MKVTGVIGISGGELARYATFYGSILRMNAPPETAIIQTRGPNIAENRNVIAEQALDLGADWVWYLDDDQVIPANTLHRLLAHKLDLVSALYLKRTAPFAPVVFDQEDAEGRVASWSFRPGDEGLQKVLAVGAGCLLVKTRVFTLLEKPYWTLGQIHPGEWSDDIDFCRRARAKGVDIWCDLDVQVGHQMNGTIWPVLEPSTIPERPAQWVTSLAQDDRIIATWDAPQ